MRQVFLDTETTGLDPAQGHRIIEIACIEVVQRRFTRHDFFKRLDPERDIDEGAVQVHGITRESLAGSPRFAEVADEFIAYAEGAELFIHNAPFDVGFLDSELQRAGKPPVASFARVTDTLAMARELHPGRKNTLDALCDRYGIDRSARTFHGALLDAELLADVYLAMTRGQDSLAIGLEETAGDAAVEPASRPRPGQLKVLRASKDERVRHAELVEHLNEASGGRALWSRLDAGA
ncbi:MAG TPA: DNA polymerase III subunit epsilon [Usitatibacteraceae bacterium]|nr:DNA polymerase III subunit epsilon [Usitatibacteraceae bacterium]